MIGADAILGSLLEAGVDVLCELGEGEGYHEIFPDTVVLGLARGAVNKKVLHDVSPTTP